MSSRSMNRVILIGNLTRDPELKYTPAGTAVCTFGIATNRSWTTADGQTKEDTQYHRLVAWQKLAELCGKLLAKGRKVYVEGRITYRSFVGKDGLQRSITEIVLDDFIVFGDGRRMGEAEGGAMNEPVKKPDESLLEQTEEPTKTTVKEKSSEREDQDEIVNPEDIPF